MDSKESVGYGIRGEDCMGFQWESGSVVRASGPRQSFVVDCVPGDRFWKSVVLGKGTLWDG